jgi:antitoxin VapB
MIVLSQEAETLAAQVASAQRVSIDTAIRLALEAQARATGLAPLLHPRRRMTVAQMAALAEEIADLPLLDTRSPDQIMDDINAPRSSSTVPP